MPDDETYALICVFEGPIRLILNYNLKGKKLINEVNLAYSNGRSAERGWVLT